MGIQSDLAYLNFKRVQQAKKLEAQMFLHGNKESYARAKQRLIKAHQIAYSTQ